MSALSTQYIEVPVTATTPAGAAYNPTSDPVSFAFITTGQPGPGDWNSGTWTATTSTSGTYLAQILIGPENGGTNLGPGGYRIWVKVTDNPEVPVIEADTLRIV
jgi:hypothetical protein